MDSTKRSETERNGTSSPSTAPSSTETDAQAKTPAHPKRIQRQRNPVVLLQDNYYRIYDDKNNRAGKPGKRKKSSSAKDSSSPLPSQPKQGNSNSGNTNNAKKRKNSSAFSDKKPSKSLSSSPEMCASSNILMESKSVYRWVGRPIENPETSGAGKHKSNRFYREIEVNVGDHPALIKVGDNVLISSSDYQDHQLHDQTTEGNVPKSPINTKSRSAAVCSMKGTDRDNDEDEVLNSTLKSEEKMDIAMNSLDPYIGRVEEMWEEPTSGQKEDEQAGSFSRMKYRVRWFFKRSDVLSLRGQFVGVSRSELASFMTPRDILLGEQTDINEVSSILGKCKVIRAKPEALVYPKRSSNRLTQSQGAFFCRYNIRIVPPPKSKGKGKIIITPYEGPDEEDNEDDSQIPSNKKSRIDEHTSSKGGTEPSSTDKNASSSADDEDDDSSQSVADRRTRKKAPVSEGSANLKIKVGKEHQATIPPIMNKRRYLPSREAPIMVWKPQEISDTKLHSYFTEAGVILKDYMKKKGYDMTRSLPHNIPTDFSVNDPEVRLASHCAFREFNVDDLFFLLHDHNYNIASALKGLKKYPEDYLFIWSKEDKALYNAGFQNHSSNLHLISKNVYLSNKRKEIHKDVVDYHYRFKIPDQFKRFQDLKREQARRMLEAGERLRLNEFLSSGVYQNGNGSGNDTTKKSQQWSKNGCVLGETGEVEARRLGCKSFLFEVRQAVGPEKYLKIVNLLKSLHAKVLTIPQLKEGFAIALEKHPKLMSRFEMYLPAMFRS